MSESEMQQQAGGSDRAFPRIRGYCPMGCGETLFVGSGGYVTCSYIECPWPDAVTIILGERETEHIVTIGLSDFTVRHPLRERVDQQASRWRDAGCTLISWLCPGRHPCRAFTACEQPQTDGTSRRRMNPMPSDGGGKAREWTLKRFGVSIGGGRETRVTGDVPSDGEKVVVVEKAWADRQLAEALDDIAHYRRALAQIQHGLTKHTPERIAGAALRRPVPEEREAPQ